MALIDCDQCGREIAGDARRCPHCGTLTGFTRAGRRRLVLVVVITALIVVLSLVVLVNTGDAPSRLQAP